MKVISQIVDTLKLHYYHSDISRQEDLQTYNLFLDSLQEDKELAMQIHGDNNDLRFVDRTIGDQKFRVMSRSIQGFSVVIKNQDVSIAFKRIKDIKNPFIKVEFRSEFLTRKGYIQATKILNNFIDRNIYKSPKIKVSELHLATDIQGYEFSLLDSYRMKTRSRAITHHTSTDEDLKDSNFATYLQGKVFSGFVIGTGDYMLRVYNKTLEIKKHRDKEHIKFNRWIQNPQYNQDNTVWRIEFQVRRAKLKTMSEENYGILDGFENVLNSIPSIWEKCIQDFTHLNLTRDQALSNLEGTKTKYALLKMVQRAKPSEIWQKISKFNGFKGYKIIRYVSIPYHSKEYLSNALKGFLSQVSKVYGDINPTTIVEGFMDCEDMEFQRKKYGLIDGVFQKQLSYFEKIEHEKLVNGHYIPSNQVLKSNIEKYVNEASAFIYFNPSKEGIDLLKKAS